MNKAEPHHTNLIEVYRRTLDEVGISDLEASWALKVSEDDFKRIMSGEKMLNHDQELVVHRFIFNKTIK